MLRTKIKLLISLIMTFGVLGTAACRSNDLGSARPDKVKVDLSLSGWESGAGQVIAQKCANCHTTQRSSFVPANTPETLDAIQSIDFFKNTENLGLFIAMRKRIETEDPKKQMPPRFATPLYDDEKAVVLEFLKSLEGGDQPPVPPPARKLTFQDISTIVEKSCGGCHDGDNAFTLRTREDFVAIKPAPLDAIMAGTMPRRKPGWKDSPDGLAVIEWLRGNQEE